MDRLTRSTMNLWLLFFILAAFAARTQGITFGFPRGMNVAFSKKQKTGVFMVAELSFDVPVPESSGSGLIKSWQRAIQNRFMMKHYHLYMNGISLGVGKSTHWEEGVTVAQFVEDFPTIAVRRNFDATSPKYHRLAIRNFQQGFVEMNPYCRNHGAKFANEFTDHFFGFRFLPEDKLPKRILF